MGLWWIKSNIIGSRACLLRFIWNCKGWWKSSDWILLNFHLAWIDNQSHIILAVGSSSEESRGPHFALVIWKAQPFSNSAEWPSCYIVSHISSSNWTCLHLGPNWCVHHCSLKGTVSSRMPSAGDSVPGRFPFSACSVQRHVLGRHYPNRPTRALDANRELVTYSRIKPQFANVSQIR
jgi:hypothetical protein